MFLFKERKERGARNTILIIIWKEEKTMKKKIQENKTLA